MTLQKVHSVEDFLAQRRAILTPRISQVYSTTGSPFTDLYAKMGDCRNDVRTFLEYLDKAFKESEDKALALLFLLRNPRGGLGERKLFRMGIKYLEYLNFNFTSYFEMFVKYGRIDDLFELERKSNLRKVAEFLVVLSTHPNYTHFVKKWLPRKPKTDKMKFMVWVIRRLMNLDRKEYRKWLSSNEVVENKMCANDWDNIDFSKVPSVASKLYKNAFLKHSPSKYTEWLQGLSSGATKVNSSVLFPVDILNLGNIVKSTFKWTDNYCFKDTCKYSGVEITNLANIDISLLELYKAQWKGLPDYVTNKEIDILPIVDVSSSMTDGYGKYKPIENSIALSVYLSERNNGYYKNKCISFSEDPALIDLTDVESPVDKFITILSEDNVGYSTNIDKIFKLILDTAVANNASQESLPSILLLLTDMEFNVGVYKTNTINEYWKEKFNEKGYRLPKVVNWNLNSNVKSFQCTVEQDNVVEVSGSSPSIIRDVLSTIDNLNLNSLVERAIKPYLDDILFLRKSHQDKNK